MRELARELLEGKEAWVVGGAVRDELLGRPVVDLDIACADPRAAAVAYARRSRGAPFPLSERHGAWRVALEGARTVDFTPLRGTIEDDLATRDFTINAIAVPLAGGEPVDPFGGRRDLDERRLRPVSASVFEDDPLRLLRAVRFVDQFGFRLADETVELIRAASPLVGKPSGERILAELDQLTPEGFRLLDELGLLEPLGGSVGRSPRRGLCSDQASARLRGEPRAVPDLERTAAAATDGAACEAAARRLTARAAPVPPRDRAVGARGARVPGCR